MAFVKQGELLCSWPEIATIKKLYVPEGIVAIGVLFRR